MTFLTILGVTEICSFKLVLEGKTGKEIPESSRLEFFEKFSVNNFALSNAEKNTSGPLNSYQKEGVDNPVSVLTYKDILPSQKIKIHQPKKDECKICVKYATSNPEEKAQLKASQQIHISNNKVMNLKLAYKTRRKEDSGLPVFNFDLEAALYAPCDKISLIYYMRKLCTHKSTLFNLVRKIGQCYIWDENEGKRGSDEIGTTIHHYPEQFHGERVVMFSDTCGGQNHYQYIAALLLYIVQNHSTLKSIDDIFMIQGHSHMELDSMHSAF